MKNELDIPYNLQQWLQALNTPPCKYDTPDIRSLSKSILMLYKAQVISDDTLSLFLKILLANFLESKVSLDAQKNLSNSNYFPIPGISKFLGGNPHVTR